MKPNAHFKRLTQCSHSFTTNSGDICGLGCCQVNSKTGPTNQNFAYPQSAKMRQAYYAQNVNRGRVLFAYGPQKPFMVNYLGRMEGQLGGSGQPPRNQLV